MKNRTLTVSLPAAQEDVFAFLSNLENLPRWATEFCRELIRDGQGWKLVSPLGEMFVTISACERTGVVDLLYGEHEDELDLLPLRVIRQPRGCTVACTVFQHAGLSDESFEWRYRALLVEFRTLGAMFGGGTLQGGPGEGAPFYPGLVTGKFYETWDFYTTHLGFRTVCECDFYVQLQHPSGAQLSLLRQECFDEQPELVSATDGRGFWLGVNVADADAEYERLRSSDVEIVAAPEDKPWDERHFVVRDPNGILIYVGHKQSAARIAEATYAGAF